MNPVYPPDRGLDQETFVRRVLESYRQTPTTVGRVRRADRVLASGLYQAGVPLRLVEDALVLAAIRRLFRPWEAAPLPLVRSLHYFQPVIDEIRQNPPDPGYMWCQRWKLANLDNYNLKLTDGKDRLEPIHSRDEHCDVDERGMCRECHVWHRDLRPCCGGRGFHRPGCYLARP